MLTTPLGKIKVYTDGACVDYKATEYSFNRHSLFCWSCDLHCSSDRKDSRRR